ncbi:MAG: hypothetical protein V7707_12995 [Motiliproteus sp.]
MTRQKKTRREAGRVPVEDMVELERKPRHTSQGKLKPKQRSVYQNEQERLKATAGQSQQPKRKNRLKSDPAAVADQSRQLMDQQGDSPAEEVKDDS